MNGFLLSVKSRLASVPSRLLRAGIIALVVFIWTPGASVASDVVSLGHEKYVALTPHHSFYRDASAAMTLAGVQEEWSRGAFSPGHQRRPSFGFTRDAIWVRWSVKNERAEPAFWVIHFGSTRMDELDLYLIRASGDVRHIAAGNRRAPFPDLVEGVDPAFPLMLGAGEQVEVFLRVHSETAVQIPLEMIDSMSMAGIQMRQHSRHAGFFGYMLALIILGILFGMIIHERGFVLFSVALIACFATYFILSGYHVWLDFPLRELVAKQGLILASEFALFMMLIYLRYLLDLPQTLPVTNRFVVWMLRASAIIVLAMLVTPYRIAYPVVLIHMSLVGGASVAVAFIAWYKGFKVARFYAIAWLFFWVFFGFSTYRHIAGESVSRPFWENAFEATACSVTFFFLAMADRVREIRRTAARSQEKLLNLEQQNSKDLRMKLRQEQLLIRDLHDGIGGMIANLAILAEVGRRDAPADQERTCFERISQLATDGSAEVRGLMSSIEARDMSWPDFIDECRRFGRLALQPHGIEFELSEQGMTDQPGPGVFAGLSLLRVIKESLTNAVKHSGATHIHVMTGFSSARVQFRVRDDGHGFPANYQRGRGLRNMESRVQEMGGTVTWQTGSSGTEVVVEIPLPVTLTDVEPVA